ncbi:MULTISPECIES: glutamine synthetase family protein [Curvivirga]|uniref:glutamine synthetase family protein n=1 Tax=Curvivirga TaxID=2856846 RepID=UPI0012BCDAE0|nr:glutamine synthetase family protein [Curvivirga aplysinae]MTI08540.1 glutamine synthetase [Curvivirga aplysinae]
MSKLHDWISENKIDEVECLVPDITGIMRGKILPADKFLSGLSNKGLRLPEVIFNQVVTGDFCDESEVVDETNNDILMVPDEATMQIVPWYDEPVAQVICDAYYLDGESLVDIAPRSILKNVLKMYDERGWKPVVAPELEFYFIDKNTDPQQNLEAPIGLSGRREYGRQAYGIEAANEFDPVVEDIYEFCERSNLDVDTMIHEAGSAQMEINFNHGDPLSLADQVFMFKRTVRQAAFKHNIYATFMAKPYHNEPGSSMHIHQSIVDAETGENIFVTKTGKNSKYLMQYIAGLQKYCPAAMPFFGPNVNSYRRISPYTDAPINTHWGYDNRTVGIRVPDSEPVARRVENRLPGADANPYLVMAATLACGLLGIQENRKPTKPIDGDAYRLKFNLPRHLGDALNKMNSARPLKDMLGERVIKNIQEVKHFEMELHHRVVTSWEREHLLLNV